MKKIAIVGFLLMLIACGAQSQEKAVRISVLGLFHPQEIVVFQTGVRPLICTAGAERWLVTKPIRMILDRATMRIVNHGNIVTKSLNCDDGLASVTEFVVTVPGKLARHYQGKLEIVPQARELVVIVAMEMETAVASIVMAESPPDAPIEALKAQAVATRSFLIAGKGRHSGFDFCDTTHCQFLRQAPEPRSRIFEATAATRGLVLAYKGETFAAMYSASCGGRTHSLEELGIAVRGYPYYAVDCDYCHRHPEKWVAKISQTDVQGLSPTESSRLKLARKLGWKTVPGNSYSSHEEDGAMVLEGSGRGHGIGLCQRGGADMARHGATFQQILEHYYPNTEIKQY
ncbi:MAG TPA: SpoIID/LytB domain-containing protein [Candidatus Angelobacter sp.]|nr:SpoIID/LytB domain-containing protein [Candidatus Angelobacter sp.]